MRILNNFKRQIRLLLLLTALLFGSSQVICAQKFVHPGIDQSAADLQLMKKLVLAGKQPFKAAFDRLKSSAHLDFAIQPHVHVLRGPYGKPNIGGDDLSKCSNLAYDCALIWYITGEKAYAEKAIAILNAWSPVLRDFDYNDAKLLAGWTGHLLCNAAEILRYTNSGWQSKDMAGFTNMLMTVYYPLIRYYFSTANGNWDGAINHSIMAIAIFTDNRLMFNHAVDHILHSPVNGSIFKYIYPSGQCQESTRDQGHVQLGLGEFAGAARVAYTQGVDLFSIGNNRIGLGFEYTAGYLLGETPYCYGKISDKARSIRDDYESVYRCYLAKGVELPFVKRAADSARQNGSRSVLTAVRTAFDIAKPLKTKVQASRIAFPAGALVGGPSSSPANALYVAPGESLQQALDATAGTGRWVIAKAGLHTLPTTLKIPSGVTLAGEGKATVLFLSPASGVRDVMVNGEKRLHDVTIQNLVVEGSTTSEPGADPNTGRSWHSTVNRGGIVFVADNEGDIKSIALKQVTVQNCTYNGVYINGAKDVTIENCDFNENGASVVPGPHLLHNLLLSHCANCSVKSSRLDGSPQGSGVALDHCKTVEISSCEVARNGYWGIGLMECQGVGITSCLIEANDRSGIMAEFLYNGSENVTVKGNQIQANNGFGLEAYACKKLTMIQNTLTLNGHSLLQQRISPEKKIIME